jgi:hypothetical protein
MLRKFKFILEIKEKYQKDFMEILHIMLRKFKFILEIKEKYQKIESHWRMNWMGCKSNFFKRNNIRIRGVIRRDSRQEKLSA